MARGDDCCYLCNECPNSFATLDELESHMSQDHLAKKCAVQIEQGPSFVKQEFFDEESEMKMDLEMNEIEEHLAGHSPTSSDSSNMSDGDDKFSSIGTTPPLFIGARIAGHSCRICGRAFDDRGQLNVHYTHTHRDKPQYECEHCQAVFCVKRELSTHLRIHSGEQPHKCDICGKEFGTRQLLKKHNMWHSGERSHVCPTCGKAFFQKGHLTQHLMIHKGSRSFRCTQCDKTFIFKFDLNRHMKIHVERGHSCGKCGKSFLKQTSLEEHTSKCKGTIGSPPTDSTRTSSPLSDISRQDSPTLTPLFERKLSTTSIMTNSQQQQQQIHSPFQMLSKIIKNENSPAEATVAPIQTSGFNTQLFMSQFNSTEEQVNAAQNLMAQYNEQNQQRLLMMTAAQRLLSLNQNHQNSAGLFCNLCNRNYPNAAAFTIHWSLLHLKNNGTTPMEDENDFKIHMAQKTTEELLNLHSDSATSSSCASSPQKISPVSHTESENKFCDHCDQYRQKTSELEKELEKKEDELNKMRQAMKRFNVLAGNLFGTQFQNQGIFELEKF